MKVFKSFILLGFLLSQCFCLKSNDTQIKNAISSLPHCCMTCVLPILSHMHCNLANLTSFADCFCNDIFHQKAITECTGHACPFTDIVVSEKQLQVICAGQPKPTRQVNIYFISVVSTIIVTIFATLRCYSNWITSKKLWWDDIFLIVSTAIFISFMGLTIWGASYGFGTHMWTANTDHWRGLLIFEWIWELEYIVVQTMTKVSVLLLYFRIFPHVSFHRLLIVLIVFMFTHCIVFGAIVINACKPIKFFWNRGMRGECINIRLVGLVGAGFSIGEDVVILSLPLPLIWKLQLKPARKIGISLILTIGVIAAAASVVRFIFLFSYNQNMDQIWDNYTLVVLSQVELSLSIACVCFPAIRLLVNRKKMNTTGNSKQMSKTSTATSSNEPTSALNFFARIRSGISRKTSKYDISIPWIASRAPQLSSVYISSQIELSDKNSSIADTHIIDHSTPSTISRDISPMPHNTRKKMFPNSDIIHVDKPGTYTAPGYKSGQNLSENNPKTNLKRTVTNGKTAHNNEY